MSLPIPSVAVMSEDVAKGQITRHTVVQLRGYLRTHLATLNQLEKSKPAVVTLVTSESTKAGMLTNMEWLAQSFYFASCLSVLMWHIAQKDMSIPASGATAVTQWKDWSRCPACEAV